MDTTLIFTGFIFASIAMGHVVYGRKQANFMAIFSIEIMPFLKYP